MRLRRLFALLTSVTMFHLAVVAGDAACLTHGAEGNHDVASHGHTTVRHAMDMNGHAKPMAHAAESLVVSAPGFATTGVPPCEIPAQQHCCGAQVGCSVAGAVTSTHELLSSGVLPAARILEALHDAPASFAPAPEPPPPKA